MSKQFYGSSKFEIQKRKPETLEESVRPFVSSRLSKQEISGTEQHRVWSFFMVFSFSFPSLNSSTDQSRLWKWLASYEAIFLQKNAPKLLECAICQSRGTASERHGFVHQQNNDTAIESVYTSFFIGEKNRKTNQLASLARRDYFYLDAFQRVNLAMYIIITFYR